MTRVGVVLFNLGGPDRPEAVRPFLYNLFSDSAILRLPGLLRPLLAAFIAYRRAKVARGIYAQIGGRSPILELTQHQAEALKTALAARHDGPVKVVIAMRYWHPLSDAAARELAAFKPDQIVLLPLYPQFSTTTTASSLTAWAEAAARIGLTVPTQAICCYPDAPGLIDALAAGVTACLGEVPERQPVRVMFSAHGLPKRVIAGGDPYQAQVEATAAATVARLAREGLDWSICYQSRVGPLEWIGPSLDAELARAGRERVAVVLVPIAFVSEHSETLVELDIEARAEAVRLGVPAFVRVPTVGTTPAFIEGLAAMVARALAEGQAGAVSPGAAWRCKDGQCGCRQR
ncbi:MAG: ferrochelatase [Defluviicoccus sp.]